MVQVLPERNMDMRHDQDKKKNYINLHTIGVKQRSVDFIHDQDLHLFNLHGKDVSWRNVDLYP